MLLSADTLATDAGVLRPGWLETEGAVVRAVGEGAPSRAADHDLGAVVVVPGFVDTHVHGAGGIDFSTASEAEADLVVQTHRRQGTTTMLASLVTTDAADLAHRVRTLSGSVRAGVIAGIHLEGPWLSTRRCGAHRADLMRDPDPGEIDRLLAIGGVRMVTLAPERAGALPAIGRLERAGVVVAVGHTEADYALTRGAVDAGATVATHLFNAMRPIGHRDPGPVIALLEDPRVTVEVIADGVHIDPAIYRHILRSAGTQRVSLVTDAMAAAGMGDGHYLLGPLSVEVTGMVARVTGTDTIAGGTAFMADTFRFGVAHGTAAGDAALLAAVAQTSTNPRRALHLGAAGLAPGTPADAVILGQDDLTVRAVLHRGRWVPTATGQSSSL